MSRALITGGAGFIGSHLVERLISRGDHVTVLDNLSTGRADNLAAVQQHPNFSMVEGSVLDAGLVERLVADAEVVYHLAAAVGVDWVLRHPLRSLETNIQGTEHVLRACAERGLRVLIASTSEVYGKNNKDALAEDDDRVLGSARLSRWFYASAKAIDEAFALAYWHERRLPVTVVRLFNTVGPRQTGVYGMVVPRFVRWALRGEPLRVYGDGEQTRCFTNVHDVVRALVALTDTPSAAGEIFNIGQPSEIRIVDLAKRVVELCESVSEVKLVPYDADEAYGERAAGYEDMRRRVPNADKLFEFTGFRPSIGLDQTLREVIDYEMGRLEATTRS
ncbi:MAG: GDP-mannose 4,6-dehydratase [Chloroflexi bacterium]|nr:GDP-mannose 4,6-dehydratase [Chloroflexota bacterium]MBV9134539.1 GDP-mannose 4,6-dehydratase [Chloroflexota bacterium]MBV9894788.1 GDP-mannose 4,6-dehydratase [Chloroflexota bacterium]